MDDNDKIHNDNLFYKFRSLDKEVSEKVRCLLKGCHKIAKYSISLLTPNLDVEENSKNYKQIVKFICSTHLEHWDSIKAHFLDDKQLKL